MMMMVAFLKAKAACNERKKTSISGADAWMLLLLLAYQLFDRKAFLTLVGLGLGARSYYPRVKNVV